MHAAHHSYNSRGVEILARKKEWNIIVDGEKKYMSKEEVLLRSMIPHRKKKR